MVSIQTNSSYLSKAQYQSSQTSEQTTKRTRSVQQSITTGFSQFNSKVFGNTQQSIGNQSALFHFNELSKDDKATLTFNGAPISDLSSDEAQGLVSENGHFGISKTSQRISEFVLRGAGENLDQLKAGREGVLRGFKDAEKQWGGKLPDISYETLTNSLKAIDEKIQELGGSVVDLST